MLRTGGKVGLILAAGLLAFPAIAGLVGFIGFMAGASNFSHQEAGLCLLAMLPEALACFGIYKIYTYGREDFFATLPQEVSLRHFWDGTGCAIDTDRKALILKSGKLAARYDFAKVQGITECFHTGGTSVQGGVAGRRTRYWDRPLQ